jgi:hypothetical protein
MSDKAPHPLTGRTRFRAGGQNNLELVLQVQYIKRTASPEGPTFDLVQLLWRDARVEDIGQLNAMRPQPLVVNLPDPTSMPEEEIPGERKTH